MMQGLILEEDFMAWIDSSSRYSHQAACDCGYRGRRRWSFGWAVMDTLKHHDRTGHLPIDPTVRKMNTHPTKEGEV